MRKRLLIRLFEMARNLNDRELGGYKCGLRLAAISYEAKAAEANDHHGPCGWFGNASYGGGSRDAYIIKADLC
jgi:hypothetical protein